MSRHFAPRHRFNTFMESTLATAQTPGGLAALRARESKWDRGIKGTTRTGLINFVEANPTFTAKLIGLQLPHGITHVGAGGTAIAYLRGETVLKVHKTSLAMSESERQQLASSEQAKHDLMASYLGSVALPQQTVVTSHPARPRQRAVVSSQQYCPFDDLDTVFPLDSSTISRTALRQLLSETPNLGEPLYSFATNSLRMAADTGYTPDVSGRQNIGTTQSDHQLILVDGLPIDATSPGAVDYLLPQLEDLRSYLDPAHAV